MIQLALCSLSHEFPHVYLHIYTFILEITYGFLSGWNKVKFAIKYKYNFLELWVFWSEFFTLLNTFMGFNCMSLAFTKRCKHIKELNSMEMYFCLLEKKFCREQFVALCCSHDLKRLVSPLSSTSFPWLWFSASYGSFWYGSCLLCIPDCRKKATQRGKGSVFSRWISTSQEILCNT